MPPLLVGVLVRFVLVAGMVVAVFFMIRAMFVLVAVGVVVRMAVLKVAVLVFVIVFVGVLVLMFHAASTEKHTSGPLCSSRSIQRPSASVILITVPGNTIWKTVTRHVSLASYYVFRTRSTVVPTKGSTPIR